jgi:hypothetical protein
VIRATDHSDQADAPVTTGSADATTDPDSTADGRDRSRVALAPSAADQEAVNLLQRQRELVGQGYPGNDALFQALIDCKLDFALMIKGQDCTELLIANLVLGEQERAA